MQNPLIDTFISQLDLTHPGDLSLAFHFARHWPATPPLLEPEHSRQAAVLRQFAPRIFGQPDRSGTCALVEWLLLELGGTKASDNNPEAEVPLAPREWLCVFREAFARGDIGPVAFGAAFGFLVVRTAGNGAPGFRADSLEARRVMLGDARLASPLGVMDDHERAALASLPDTVTLWRGGSLAPGERLSHRANGLHWALDRDYALLYMRGRNAVLALAARDQTVTPLWDALGRPFLLTVEAPREMLLAYKAAGIDRSCVEVFVDFDRLPAPMIHDVTPTEYRWAA